MPNKNIYVNVDCASLPPSYTLTGNVNPNNPQIVDIDPGADEDVTWLIVVSSGNQPVSFATPAANGVPAIQFAPGAPWADGSAPAIVYDSASQVHLNDDNLSAHSGPLSHYYTINIVINGVVYPLDPEIEEQGGGGR